MSRSPWKFPFRFLRTRGWKAVPCRLSFLVPVLLLLSVCPAVGAPENAPSAPSLTDVPPGMAMRWMNYFYMTVPSDWKPMMERDGVGFFTGAHPDAMDDPSLADLPMVALAVTRQKAPREETTGPFSRTWKKWLPGTTRKTSHRKSRKQV